MCIRDSNKDIINENKRNKYKEKLKESGKKSRDEQNAEIRAKIKSLRAKGFLVKEIAKQLNLTSRTVSQHIKYLKEEL